MGDNFSLFVYNMQVAGSLTGAELVPLTYQGAAKTVNQVSLYSGVAQLQTSTAHGFSAGQSVVVAGLTNTQFNGAWTIIAVTSTTFSFMLNSANVVATGDTGTASLLLNEKVAVSHFGGAFLPLAGGTMGNDAVIEATGSLTIQGEGPCCEGTGAAIGVTAPCCTNSGSAFIQGGPNIDCGANTGGEVVAEAADDTSGGNVSIYPGDSACGSPGLIKFWNPARTFFVGMNTQMLQANQSYTLPDVSGAMCVAVNTNNFSGTGSVSLTSIFTQQTNVGAYLGTVVLGTEVAGSAGTATLTLEWTDDAGTTSQTTATLQLNTPGRVSMVVPMSVNPSTAVKYSVSVSGNVGATWFANVRFISEG